MDPNECPNATIIQSGKSDFVQCVVINELVGLTCAHASTGCTNCAWDKGDLSHCQRVAKKHLVNLIANGNQPHFYAVKDLRALSEKFATIATPAERQDLLAESIAVIATVIDSGKIAKVTDGDQQLTEIEAGLGLKTITKTIDEKTL